LSKEPDASQNSKSNVLHDIVRIEEILAAHIGAIEKKLGFDFSDAELREFTQKTATEKHRQSGALKESGAPTPNTEKCKNCKVPRHYRVFGNLAGDVILKEPFDESATDGDFLRKALAPEIAMRRELEIAQKLRALVVGDQNEKRT